MFNFFNNAINNQNASTLTSGEKFEILQKARQDLVGEIQAIIEYDNHIHSSNDKVANKTWEHIMQEELNHVGKLLVLIDYLDPSQKEFVESGIKEFNDEIK